MRWISRQPTSPIARSARFADLVSWLGKVALGMVSIRGRGVLEMEVSLKLAERALGIERSRVLDLPSPFGLENVN